jgi:hypothetical protein
MTWSASRFEQYPTAGGERLRLEVSHAENRTAVPDKRRRDGVRARRSKKELVNRRSWPNRDELGAAVFDVEVFYNRERRHSTLGCRFSRRLNPATAGGFVEARSRTRTDDPFLTMEAWSAWCCTLLPCLAR